MDRAAKVFAGTRVFDMDRAAKVFAGTRVFDADRAAKVFAGTRVFDMDRAAKVFAGQLDVGSLVAQIAAAARLVDAVIAAPETSGSEVRSSRVSRGPLVDDRTVVLTALLVLLIALMALIETSDPVLSEHLNNVLSLPVGIVLAVAASDWQRRRG